MAGLWRKLKKSLSLKAPSQSDPNFDPSTDSSSPENGNTKAISRHSASRSSSSSSGSVFFRSFSLRSSKKTCAICLGGLREGKGQAVFTAECSHTFHFRCIATNVSHGNRICPICRSEWKDIPFQATTNFSRPRGNRIDHSLFFPHIQPPQDILSQSDPDHFSDDEPLPDISTGPIAPPRPQPMSVKIFPEFPAVSASDFLPKFPLLVRICAPPLQDDARGLDRAPIDLVALLDVSGSMSPNMTLLKRAIRFVIQNLGPSDRLSIVTFSSSARRIFPLKRMSNSGRQEATEAVRSLSSSGGTDIVEGLNLGVRVLEERRQQNPVPSIILLSDGQDTCNTMALSNLLPASISPGNRRAGDDSRGQTIPVHTFGFGKYHDSTAMHAISDESGGTFSFIESIDILQDAFARCIGGLLSVVAQGIRLTVRSLSSGVQIVSLSSGRYKNEISDQGQKVDINVESLYADEARDFLVYVSIPVFSTIEGDDNLNKTPVVDVSCTYKDPVSLETIQVESERLELQRLENLSPTDSRVCLEVDRQRNRLLVAKAIEEAKLAAEMGNLAAAQTVLGECQSVILSSASAQAGDSVCNWLDAELRETGARMVNMELYEHTGRAYILSGLSSHLFQRATTRSVTLPLTGQAENSSMNSTNLYDTPSMVSMVSLSQNLGHSLVDLP